MVSFESPKQGKLLILHGSGDEAMSVAIIPSSQDTATALVKADNLVEGTDFEIQDYKAEEVGGANVYSYTVHYLNDKSEYAYVVNKYITDNTSEFYSVAGSALTEDSLSKIKTSVDSFQISGDSALKAATPGTTQHGRNHCCRYIQAHQQMELQLVVQHRWNINRWNSSDSSYSPAPTAILPLTTAMTAAVTDLMIMMTDLPMDTMQMELR